MRISYSAYDTFNRCPLQYKFSYIDKIKTPEKPELFFGGLIHKIVQYALKKDPILPEVNELLDILKNKWQEEIFASPKDSEQYFKFGQDMIRKFYVGHRPGLRNIVAVEKFFQIPLSEKHVLSGVIDRIDKLPFGAFEVIDYKTNKALSTQMDVDRDKQLGIYNLAVENLWPEAKDIRLTLYFLKYNFQITTTRRPDEIQSIKEEVIQTAETIENTNDFPPKSNALCHWCSYQYICPLMKDRVDKDANKEENREIDKIVEDYILAHQTIQELEPKIQTHFDKKSIERYFHPKGTLTRGKTKKFSIKKP